MADSILIVDDNKINRLLLASILEDAGFGYSMAENGEEAIEKAINEIPDLILLDIMMPGKDGYQVCKELKREAQTENIPIIFLSAMMHTEDKIKGLELGGTDYVTKPFNAGELLARVNAQLKIRHLTESLIQANRDLQEKQDALTADLKAASEIQKSLLPKPFSDVPGMEVAWQFHPCDTVGGDIFHIYQIDEKHCAFYMIDVSGHGVPSAMITVSVHQQLRPETGLLVKEKTSPPPHYRIVPPAEVLTMLDRENPIDRFDKYFTISYMLLDLDQGFLTYSSAAHPPPVLLRHNGELELLKEGGTIIGMDGIVPFEQGERVMQPGDTVFLFTDGIPEYRNRDGEFYGEGRFHDAIARNRDASPQEATRNIVASVIKEFGDNSPPQDDISLLAVKYIGPESGSDS